MATAVYPDNVRSFGSDVVDFTTTILAEHVNFLRAEVNSIETVLGNLPLTTSGWVGSFSRSTTTWNTVRDRIANIEYGLNVAYNAKVPTGGTQYQVLQKNSSSDYDFSWVTFNGLPSQTSNNGKFLTTNGSAASWTTISQVPSQSGANGKYLTSDGTTASWGTVNALPSQSGNGGKYLTTDGSSASWSTVSSGGANEFVLMMMGA
jgi:hypothetical protein